MIVMHKILKPVEATLVRTGTPTQIPAGVGGAFIVHRNEPVLFDANGEMCQLTLETFCDATGRTLDDLESIFAMECEDDDDAYNNGDHNFAEDQHDGE